MKYILALALVAALLFAAVFAQEVDSTELAHVLQKKESLCTDRCVTLTSIASEKCLNICSNIVTSKQSVESALKRFKKAVKGGKNKKTSTLSDNFNGEAAEQQKEATKHLWELFHTNMKQILANSGTPDAGFQMLPNAIEGSSIRQVAGDEMPAAALSSLSLEDFDNPEFLGRELIQVSTPGPHRNTRGIRWIDEYKAFLAGVAGISQIPQIPDPDQTESAQKAVQYMDELAKCQDNYFTSRFSQMYNMEQFQNMFCARVSFLQREMFAALGREQARIGNNPAYAASVALGMAQGLYTDSTAFKKSVSVRMMEWDCLRSQVDPSIPYRASPRSFNFAYNHHSYKRTQKSSSFNISVGIPVINTTIGVNSQKGKETSADLTAIGGVGISFADVKYVPLYAGNWFSPTAMRDFRWFRREASASPISRFFNADGGTMNLFPRALIIGVNPTITLNVETSAKESFIKTSQLAVTAGGSIFGLELNAGFNKQARVEEGKENGGNTQINIKSESCVPQLFAVDNYYYY